MRQPHTVVTKPALVWLLALGWCLAGASCEADREGAEWEHADVEEDTGYGGGTVLDGGPGRKSDAGDTDADPSEVGAEPKVDLRIIQPLHKTPVTSQIVVRFTLEGEVEAVDGIVFSLDGVTVADLEPDARFVPFDPHSVEDGLRLLSVKALLDGGRSASDSVSVLVDVRPPSVEILEPPAEGHVTPPTLVRLAVSDVGDVTEVEIAVPEAGLSETLFRPPWESALSWEGEASEAPWTLIVTATDSFGHRGSVQRTLWPHSAPPRVAIGEPNVQSWIGLSTFDVLLFVMPGSYLAYGQHELRVSVDGEPVEPVEPPAVKGERVSFVLPTPPDERKHVLHAALFGPDGGVVSDELVFQSQQLVRYELLRCLSGAACYVLEEGDPVEGVAELRIDAEVREKPRLEPWGVWEPWDGEIAVAVGGVEIAAAAGATLRFDWDTRELSAGTHSLGVILRRGTDELAESLELRVGACPLDSCDGCCEDSCGDRRCEPHRNETHVRCPEDCPCEGTCVPESGDPMECLATCGPGTCGDGLCAVAAGEMSFCLEDCPTVCGDGLCKLERGEADATFEEVYCPADCGELICGDCVCDLSAGENMSACPHDCGWACGNRVPEDCDMVMTEVWLKSGGLRGMDCRTDLCVCPPSERGGGGAGCGDGCCRGYICEEDPWTCPNDCMPPCGNAICDPGETPESCAEDCRTWACGNGVCDRPFENSDICPTDCRRLAICGDCRCTEGESFRSCPNDCGYCGDGICSDCAGEERVGCALDCYCGDGVCDAEERRPGAEPCHRDCICDGDRCVSAGRETPTSGCGLECTCGDGACEPGKGETARTCAVDCPCGDGYCAASIGENAITCVRDCHCGNKYCESRWGEDPDTCPEDCQCGDGVCDPCLGENTASCFEDCHCGDGVCMGSAGEDPVTCPPDCLCTNGVCEPEKGETPEICPRECHCGNGRCEMILDERHESCPEDCRCGDGICMEEDGETALFCGQDCRCGNNYCEAGIETMEGCPADCYCGNRTCDLAAGETAEDCPGDCACGNGICNKDIGETNAGCPEDCSCGDLVCDAGAEDAASCPEDCCRCGNCKCEKSCGEDEESCPTDCVFGCIDGKDDLCDAVLSVLFVLGHPEGRDCRPDLCRCEGPDGELIGSGCGDGCCMGFPCGEGPTTCPYDCRAPCGDGICEVTENASSCLTDCFDVSLLCGNGICEQPEESVWSCEEDCRGACGNCVCEPSEGYLDCPVDCGSCGDGVCSQCLGERASSCAADCAF